MDRTVPSSASQEIALYIRTYYSLLRSSREVQIKTLVEAHTRINSALHVAADEDRPDMAAFIYAVLRVPDCLDRLRLVVLGQSDRVFAQHGYPDVESWQAVSAPARRRRGEADARTSASIAGSTLHEASAPRRRGGRGAAETLQVLPEAGGGGRDGTDLTEDRAGLLGLSRLFRGVRKPVGGGRRGSMRRPIVLLRLPIRRLLRANPHVLHRHHGLRHGFLLFRRIQRS